MIYRYLVPIQNPLRNVPFFDGGIKPTMNNNWTREAILKEALALTTGDRNATYGDPYTNLSLQTQIFSSILGHTSEDYDRSNPAVSVIALIAAKLARINVNPKHRDNYVDLAAYAAILGEVVAKHLDIQ